MRNISTKLKTHALKTLALSACVLVYVNCCYASDKMDSVVTTDSVSKDIEHESLFPQSSKSLDKSHFTWGAEAGASIDLTGFDMSTIDVDVLIGYKNAYLNMLGIGVGVHRNVRSGDNFIPLYAAIQTSFRKQPSLLFYSAKIGYSFNTIESSAMFGDLMASMGCGINLSKGRLARSFILLSAGYRYFNDRHMAKFEKIDRHYIFDVSLSIGILF